MRAWTSPGDPDLLVAIATVRAKLRHGSGRLAAALEVLHTARRELGGAPLAPSVERALALTEAELRISGGDLGAARRLVATGGDPEVYAGWAACVDASAALVEGKAAAAAATAAQYATPSVDTALTWTVHAAILTSLAAGSSATATGCCAAWRWRWTSPRRRASGGRSWSAGTRCGICWPTSRRCCRCTTRSPRSWPPGRRR